MSRPPLHPPLIAAAFVLLIWSANAGEVDPSTVPLPLGLAVASSALLLAVLGLLLGTARGGVVASIIVLVAGAYGYVWDASGSGLGPVWRLALTVVVVAAVVTTALQLLRGRFTTVSQVLDRFGLAIVVVALIGIVPGAVGRSEAEPETREVEDLGLELPDEPRDVYYIVPDRYGRDDVFAQEMGFDNSAFLDELRQLGFAIAEESLTNYPKTAYALAANLNLTYVQNDGIEGSQGLDGSDWTPLYDHLEDNDVGHHMVDLGYEYHHLGSWWEPTRTHPRAHRTYGEEMSEFASAVVRTTPWPDIAELFSAPPTTRERHGLLGLRQFEALEQLARRPADRPRYVFAHILLPHGPYVFDADGSWVDRDTARSRSRDENFVRQLRYTNERLLALLRTLLDRPEEERPIVIIQADEGPDPLRYEEGGASYRHDFVWPEATDEELQLKFPVLTAVHIPELEEDELRDDITGVNTWRWLLDREFGAELGELDERAYVFHDESRLYDFTEVTDRVRRQRPS